MKLSPATPERAQAQYNYGAIMSRLGKGRSWTPWLLIRYAQIDAGQRPIPLADVYWASPDIWVESSDASGNAVPGEPNFVHARIFNLGKAPALPTRADFYWGNPATGLGPGQMNLIGTEWIQVPAHSVQVVRCNIPWIPVYENGGHECLIVNCTSPILDPITQPFQTTLDRHVGQRNITVLQGEAGQMITFTLGVNNIFPLTAQVVITARTEEVTVTPAMLASMALRDVVSRIATLGVRQVTGRHKGPKEFHVVRSALALRTQLSKPIRTVPTKDARAYLGHLLLADQMADARHTDRNHGKPYARTDRGQIVHDTMMQAFEQRRLNLQFRIPANTPPGAFIVVRLAQSGFGISMGGYIIVIHVASQAPVREGRGARTARVARPR